MPKYFGLREAAQSLLEAIPAEQDHDLILFDVEKWVAAQWRDGLLKITGRPLNNARLGDRIEVEPHSDRDIHWREGAEQELRIYEMESPGRGAVTGEWRGLEIGGEDLARLKEHIEGAPPEIAPASPAALAEAAVPEPEAAQPIPAAPAEAPGEAPAPASTHPPPPGGQLPVPTEKQLQAIIRKYVKDRSDRGRVPNEDEAVQIVQKTYRITREKIRQHYRKVTGRNSTHRGRSKL